MSSFETGRRRRSPIFETRRLTGASRFVKQRLMTASLPALLATGFVLGWSVAWPPGPINAEIARRCAAGDFRAGVAVLAGASSADALWAVAVALGVGFLFAAPLARNAMGVVSVALLLALAFLFLRGAWRAFAKEAVPEAGGRRLLRPTAASGSARRWR